MLAGVTLFVRRHREWHAWALLAMMLTGMVLVVNTAGPFPALELLVPGYWLFPIVTLMLRSGQRRRYVPSILGATALTMAAQTLCSHDFDWMYLADHLWILQPALELLLFGDAVVMITRHLDRSVAADLAARDNLREQQVLSGARREAARMLHDHVLHALLALSRAVDEPTAVQAVDECRRATDALSAGPGLGEGEGEPEMVPVECLVADDPVLAEVGAHLFGQSKPLPVAVARAVAAATHEALTNVARHADAENTRVEVVQGHGSTRVRITDDGRGFDPARRPADRMGVGRSILQRLDDVGGHAEITSAPGQGTTVDLCWPRSEGSGDIVGWRAAPDRIVRRMLTRTAWPGLATAILMIPFVAPQTGHRALLTVVSLTALAVGILAASVLTRRALGARELTGLFVVANLAWAVNLWAVPMDPRFDYLLWMGWGISSLVHLVVLSSAMRAAILVASGWLLVQAGGLLARYQSFDAIVNHSFLLTTGPGDVVVTLCVLAAVQRTARAEAEAARHTSDHRLAAAQLQARSHLDRFWSRRVVHEALPLLTGVADGSIDPREPGAAERARVLETVLRDELVLGPDHADLVAALAGARHAGWQVVAPLTPSDGDGPLDAAGSLVGMLGEPVRPGQPVTVSAQPASAAVVVLQATPTQQDRWPTLTSHLGGQVDSDEGFVRVVLPALAAS